MKKYYLAIIMFLLFSMLFSYDVQNFIIIYKSKGFITERKKIAIKKGSNTIYFFNNDEGIIKDTIFVKFEKDEIKNLSYKFIEPYIPEEITGKKIKVFLESKVLEGEVVANLNNELVLKTKNSIYKINREKITYLEYQVENFQALTPGNLVVNFDSNEQKMGLINLNYFTGSLSWSAAYNLIFNEDENECKMDLNINIQNRGSRNYKNSKIYVVSGDVRTEVVSENYNRFVSKAAQIQTYDAQNIQQQKLSDFYEYDIKGVYDIDARQNITVYVIKNNRINFSKEYIYDSSVDSKGVMAKFLFKNIKENNLGIPLPTGEASLFMEKGGNLHFIGKDMIKDTPEKEQIELKSGRVFDINVERKHLFTEKIANNVWEEKYSIVFKNYKKNKIKIKVIEKINAIYWEIRESSHNYKRIDNQTIEFEIDVESQKSTEIVYKVRKRY